MRSSRAREKQPPPPKPSEYQPGPITWPPRKRPWLLAASGLLLIGWIAVMAYLAFH